MSQTEHHTTISELGFTVADKDLPFVNEYQGRWAITGTLPLPENHWVVTMDGEGHPVPGHLSPGQLLAESEDRGWQSAYVAPYGRFVQGEVDGIELHEWIRERRHKSKARSIDQKQDWR